MTEPAFPDDPLEFLRPSPEHLQWVVLHTKPRCEKKLVLHSRQKQARTYMPTVRRVHNYGKRVRHHDVPLFNGYVFAQIERADRAWFRQNPYVANLIEVMEEERMLASLRTVAEALRAEVPVEVLPFLQPGRTVKIIGGPMKGAEAVVAEIKGKNRVILHLELIQQSVAMEIDAAYLKAAD